jgi:thiol:disulfide interchange protein DsbD
MIRMMFAAALLTGLLARASPACAAVSDPVTADHVIASVVSDTDHFAPGRTLRIGLHLRMQTGWHTYWSNPGDAGAPPTIDVAGAKAGPIAYPTPQLVRESGLTSFVYTGDLLLPVTVTPAASAHGSLPLRVQASWLVCANVCIPEQAEFSLTLPEGQPAPSAEAPLFAAADDSMPRQSPFSARVFANGLLVLDAPNLSPKAATFFPAQPGVLDQGAEPKLGGDLRQVTVQLKPLHTLDPKAHLDGVLVLTDQGGETAALHIDAAPAGAASPGAPATGLTEALLLAFAGGLILNLMPCVLPVLAMKVLAVARLSGRARWHVRREAGFYTLGVLTAFAFIGVVILTARAAGDMSGWGVQFQSAAFTAAMGWLLFAIGLNLSGVFQVGGQLAGVGQKFASRGSFATGLLAVVVATPCTAPFMATALAAASAMPAASAMLIFLALGLGLAAPYAALALIPGVARFLPKPGAWMDLLKQALAFPMYAAALWMAWVVSQQTGSTGLLAVLAGFLAVGFAAWAFGYAQAHEGPKLLRAGALLAAAGLAGLLVSLAAAPPSTAKLAMSDGAEPFSPARLAALRAEKRPVLVDMTAAWCVTCLVNERVALAPASVRQAFAKYHVAYLKGDWTRQDAGITAFLQAFGRTGVPLYVYYPAGGDGEVLPQILTEGEILSRLGGQA